jgi:WD40 repeat protein
MRPNALDDRVSTDPPFRVRHLAATAVLLVLARPDVAAAQGRQADFTEPLVVLDTGGHHAPVRSLIFAPDRSQLLSGGLDKVVNIWDLRDGRLDRSRTIRPLIWRGHAGAIYAMALSPPLAAEGGERLLAVAGHGVGSSRGNIALYRYPGAAGPSTGDVVALFRGGVGNERVPTGHIDRVTCLAFSPDGRWLVSGGGDGRVLVWDVASRSVVGGLPGHTVGVRALALSPDGRTAYTGDVAGGIRSFDLANRRLRASAPVIRSRIADPLGVQINALAVSPSEGRWLVVGREDGRLLRYDAPTLGDARSLPRADNQGGVLALAFDHTGTRLATSILRRLLERVDLLPDAACDIELRAVPDGQVISRVATTAGVAFGLAFSADDGLLAFSGGLPPAAPNEPNRETQGIVLKDLRNANRPLVELKGRGSSLVDVGFAPDGRTVGFSRVRPARPPAPGRIEGFDIPARRVVDVDGATLRRALTTWGVWSVRPVENVYTLDVVDTQNRGHRIKLDRDLDGRWWSWTFLPGAAGHRQPTLAIGCDDGVLIINLDTGQRTRYFAGHAGPVYALAPSADGRWLVTGSSDQTVRLWALAGCDTPPPLGATLRRAANGVRTVATITPNGFADRMGLKAGDVVEKCYVGAAEQPQDTFFGQVNGVLPNTQVVLQVRRAGAVVRLLTTRRESPALSLFPGEDGEWVAWVPEGYYDASPAGDRRYLGWHRNAPWLSWPLPAGLAWFRWPSPTDFFPAQRFEAELRRPAVLDVLFRTADMTQALAAAAPPAPPAPAPPPAPVRPPAVLVAEDAPPRIRLLAPAPRPDRGALAVGAPALTIRAVASSGGSSLVSSLRVLIDGRQVAAPTLIVPPSAEVDRELPVTVPPGRYRLSVVATNAKGKERSEGFDVEYAAPPPREPRLVVVAAGTGAFDDTGVPAIRFADRDLGTAHAFLVERGREGRRAVEESTPLTGSGAKAEPIQEALLRLEQAGLGPRDTAVVAIESHLLACREGRFLLARDSSRGQPPRQAIAATEVADVLGRVAASGCRVVLLVDAVHAGAPADWSPGLGEWVRDLTRQNVITFVASNHGPSERGLGSGAFFQAVRESTTARARARPWVDPNESFTLDDFQAAVVQRVLELTGRRQNAFCYVPETLPRLAPFLDARPSRVSLAPGSVAGEDRRR